MKKTIPLHLTSADPENTIPFTILFNSAWEAYDSGALIPEMMLMLSILYRLVNPHRGIGKTSYDKLCTMLKKKPNKQNINKVNKLMVELRDSHELIWFPEHSGSRDFSYVIDGYKVAPLEGKSSPGWVCTKKYKEEVNPRAGLVNRPASTESTIGPLPSQEVPWQSLRRSENGSFKHISHDLEERYGRGSQTYND